MAKENKIDIDIFINEYTERTGHKLTKTELAKAFNITLQSLYNLKKEVPNNVQKLHEISLFFNTNINEMIKITSINKGCQ